MFVYFCLIPSRVEIRGNEIVDRQRCYQVSTLCNQEFPTHMKRLVRSRVLKKWEDR